jgi:hypothetical protein
MVGVLENCEELPPPATSDAKRFAPGYPEKDPPTIEIPFTIYPFREAQTKIL